MSTSSTTADWRRLANFNRLTSLLFSRSIASRCSQPACRHTVRNRLPALITWGPTARPSSKIAGRGEPGSGRRGAAHSRSSAEGSREGHGNRDGVGRQSTDADPAAGGPRDQLQRFCSTAYARISRWHALEDLIERFQRTESLRTSHPVAGRLT